jgi:hypothetical protein
MGKRPSTVGLVILGLLIIGVFWARDARHGPEFAAAGGGAAPDVTLEDRTVDLGDVRLTLSIVPRPVTALARHRYRIRIECDGAVLPVEDGRLSFAMDMPMGDHRYTLVAGPDGWYEADVTLPICQSGRHRWSATVDGRAGGERRRATFLVDVGPAGSPSRP